MRYFKSALLFAGMLFFSITQAQEYQVHSFAFLDQWSEVVHKNLTFEAGHLQAIRNDLDGLFRSNAISIPFVARDPFIALSLEWQVKPESTLPIELQIRNSSDGQEWNAWQTIQVDPHAPESPGRFFGQMQLIDADFAFIQFQMKILPHSSVQVQQLKFHYYYPGENDAPPVGTAPASPEACTCMTPNIIERTDWCPAGNCPTIVNPTITEVTHLIVHHSATSNTSTDWAAVVRSIWNTHVNSWGWSDIGYNWLVDPTGQLYRGRGQGIQGAHFCGTNAGTTGVCMLGNFQLTPPSNAAQQTLQAFLAWQSCLEDIDPLGNSFHNSSNLNLAHISGHRDGCSTECPGNTFYPLFNGIRQGVQNYIDLNCNSTSTHTTPQNENINLAIFPNPNSGTFQLQSQSEQSLVLFLNNAQGQIIWRGQLAPNEHREIQMPQLSAGLYWLNSQTTDGRRQRQEKLIIQ
ncbi:MAG: N-acetylmuramoyl-L-alanine amidase [Bacteroidota bacterium]